MAQQALSLIADPARGSVRISGSAVPNGHVTLTRTSAKDTPVIIRGGEFDLTASGFLRQDTDVSYGVPVTYRATVTGLANRVIQTNRVLNPKAKDSTNNWATNPNRVLSQETGAALIPTRDARTSLKVSTNTGGTVSGTLNDRLIAGTTPSGFGPGNWYIGGQVRFTNSDLWLWGDVKTAGTWQTIKDKGNWQQVKSSSSEAAGQAYTSMWVAAASPTGAATETRRNLATNPSFETGTTGWSAYNGGTLALSTAQKFSGSNSAMLTMAAAGGGLAQGTGLSLTGLTIGTTYTASVYVYVPAGTVSAQLSLWINGTNNASASMTTAGVWTRLWVTWTATSVNHTVSLFNNAPTTAGMTAYLDAALVEPGTTPGAYFDGSSIPAGSLSYSWTGTANASASIQTTSDLTVFGNPVQLLGLPSNAGNTWRDFSGWINVPSGAPAGVRLVFYHGTQVREYANTWWLTTVMVTPDTEMDSGSLAYFDGDTPLPANPAANMLPDANWEPVTADASIAWNGTTNASVSVFTGPSAVTATATTLVSTPGRSVVNAKVPLLLSDPVTSSLGVWFELLKIGTLSFKERADLYDVLGRGPQIAVSQARAWASGQLTLMTYTLEEIPVVERLFGSGRILLMRNPDPRYPENDWYLHIGQVDSDRVGSDTARPERAWVVPFVRVERPVGLIEGSAGTTWGQAKAGYASWGDARTKRLDWLEGALETPA